MTWNSPATFLAAIRELLEADKAFAASHGN